MHLVEQGHKRIAYITKFEPIQPVLDRIQGYIDSVNTANIPEIILTIPLHEGEWDWTVADTVFKLPEENVRPQPLCLTTIQLASSWTDWSALAYRCRAMSPDCLDNISPSLQNGPGLTTVAQPFEEIGINAVQLLLRRLNDPSGRVRRLNCPRADCPRKQRCKAQLDLS